jgi:uncharacterized cupredoxin-like copper-binding protein
MVALIVGTVVAGGCARQQPAQAPPPPGGGPVEVRVTLSDFTVVPSQTDFVAGWTYRFVATNQGAVNHEFMITPPMMAGMSMEKMHEMALLEIEEDDLPPGATRTLEYTFPDPAPAGKWEFACHVEGHYAAGMHVPIVIQPATD